MSQRKDATKTQRRDETLWVISTLSFERLLLAALPLCVFALMLLSFLLRFHALGAQSLWHDEGNSVVQALRTFTAIADNAARDIHPPGYYWLLALTRLLFGESEFGYRSLSAFAGVITVALTYAIARRTVGAWAGVLAALLVALNTFQIYYAQEARMYALLALIGAASIGATIRLIDRPTWARALGLGVINAAGLWTHYAFPFVMIAGGVGVMMYLVGRARLSLGYYIAANLVSILLFVPWLPTALERVGSWPSTGDPVALGDALNTLVRWFGFGITAQNIGFSIPVILLTVGLMVFPNRRPANGQTRGKVDMWIFPVLLAVMPTAIFLAFGLFREANIKFLIASQVGAAIWLARGVWVISKLPSALNHSERTVQRENNGKDSVFSVFSVVQFFSVVLAGAITVWMLGNLWGYVPRLYDAPAYQRADYRDIARIVASELDTDDAVILNAPNQVEVFNYYYRGSAPVYGLPYGLNADDEAISATTAELDTILDTREQVYAVFWGDAERDPLRLVETALDTRGYEIDNRWFNDVRLARYALGDTPDQACARETTIFGGIIALESCAISALAPARGDVLKIALGWRTVSTIDSRYTVFIQLLDENGILAVQRDSEPVGGSSFTSDWRFNLLVNDHHALILDVPPGEYTLIVGLYNGDTGARLLLENGTDYLVITTITVND